MKKRSLFYALTFLISLSHGQSYLTAPDESYSGNYGRYGGPFYCGTSQTNATNYNHYTVYYYLIDLTTYRSFSVDMCNSDTDYDSGVSIWGYNDDFVRLDSNDDGCSGSTKSYLEMSLDEGVYDSYWLVVGGYSSNTGNYRVDLDCDGNNADGGGGGGGGSSSSEANNKNMGMQVIIPLTMIFSFFGLVKYFGKIRNIKKKLWENPNQAELINQVNSNSSTATGAAAPATTTTTPGVATAAPIRLNPQPQVKYVYTAQRPVQVVQAQPQTQTRVVYAVAAKPGVTTAVNPNPTPVYQPPQSSGFQPPSRAQAMANFSPSPGPGAAAPPAYAPTSTPQEAPPAYVPATSDGAPPPYSPGGY